MTKLEKALEEESQKTDKKLVKHSSIEVAQKLLEAEGARDLEMLRHLGMHTSVIRVKNLQGKLIEKERANQTYGGEVYTREEIKTVACKYALKFLRTANYNGHIDPGMIPAINNFLKENGFSDENFGRYSERFYLLAAPQTFKQTDIPKTDPDPVLFFELDTPSGRSPASDDTLYKRVYQWGSELTFWRRILGWKYRDGLTYWLWWIILINLILLPVQFIPSLHWGFRAGILLSSVLIGFGRLVGEEYKFKEWDKIWNDTEKGKR